MKPKHGQLDIFHITKINKNIDLINFVLWLDKMNITELHPDDPIGEYIGEKAHFKDLTKGLLDLIIKRVEFLLNDAKLYNDELLYTLLFSLNEDLGLIERENWSKCKNLKLDLVIKKEPKKGPIEDEPMCTHCHSSDVYSLSEEDEPYIGHCNECEKDRDLTICEMDEKGQLK